MSHQIRACLNLAIAAFLASLLVFAYPLTNFALHIDDELLSNPGAYGVDIAMGRWGITFAHAVILPRPFVPFFTPILSLALLSAAAVATAIQLNHEPAQRYVLVLLYVACPQFAYQLDFPFQSDCLAFGILSATLATLTLANAINLDKAAARPLSLSRERGGEGSLAVASTNHRRILWAAASIALLIAGLSVYQSILFVPPTIALLSCLNRVVTERTTRSIFAQLASVLGLLVVSYAGYSLITVLVQQLTEIPHAAWMSAFIGWSYRAWPAIALNAVDALARDMEGGNFYGNGIYLTTWVALAAILATLAKSRGSAANISVAAILGIALLASPFALVPLFGADLPARIFLSEPVAFAGIWVIALRPAAGRLAPLQAAVVALSLLYGCYHVSSLFFADTMALEADKLLASRIVETIYRADPAFDEATTPVYFSGATSPPDPWRGDDFDVFGGSFFAWDGGNPDRIIAFLKLSGIATLRHPSVPQIATARLALPTMPNWPNPNAVRLIGNVMVVKLGPTKP